MELTLTSFGIIPTCILTRSSRNAWLPCGIFALKEITVFRLKLSEEGFLKFMQFVKFALVGLSNSLISYVVYLIAIKLGLHYQIANFLGFTIRMLPAFIAIGAVPLCYPTQNVHSPLTLSQQIRIFNQ